MPPRSYYNEPRKNDYIAYAKAYFGQEFELAREFIDTTGRPFVEQPEHLAAYLGISASLVRQILHHKGYHYRNFDLPKGNGEFRKISTPKTYLKVIQWWILDNVLVTVQPSSSAHGFVKDRSHVSNAQVHLGANHLLNVDIRKFFPSISNGMITTAFRRMGYGEEGARLLTELCTLDRSAPTGAPTSPALGNLVLGDLDAAMEKLASNSFFNYTRYADDLCFSSQERIPTEFLDDVSEIVENCGFSLNDKKTKFMGRGDRLEVTGIVINEFANPTREWRNWARGYLHRVIKNPDDFSTEWQRVSGVYGTLKSIDSNEERKLTRTAKRALWSVAPNFKKTSS